MRAIEVLIRRKQTCFEAREATPKFRELIAGLQFALSFKRIGDGGDFGGLNPTGLAIPKVETSPVRETTKASSTVDCSLDEFAAGTRFGEFFQSLFGRHAPTLPRILGAFPKKRPQDRGVETGEAMSIELETLLRNVMWLLSRPRT